MNEELERHEFEKMVASIRRKQAEQSAAPLSPEAMEYEMDHCPAPWLCPRVCYVACIGCVRRKLDEAQHIVA